jgi:hypothetical protein
MSTSLINAGVQFPDGTIQTTRASSGTGTVTGVTGTAPIASSGGAAPVISIAAATTGAAGSMSAVDKQKLDGISGSNTGDQTNITGNAGTATRLQTARTINGTAFDGSANITIASASSLPTSPSGKNWVAFSSDSIISGTKMVLASDGTIMFFQQGTAVGWQTYVTPIYHGGSATLP